MGGASISCLEKIRAAYPISLHGTGLSLGSADGIDTAHLEKIRLVVDRIAPGLVSEHLSWSIADGTYLADLLPLPLTEEALEVVCRHVDQAQSYLKRQILIENPSSYLLFHDSSIPEWEFLAAVARRTGCGILCDVNNIFVCACNHGWDASLYLASLPTESVREIHLAGHAKRQMRSGRVLRIDDHGSHVAAEVWTLYESALARFGPLPTLIEWDTEIPPFEVLLQEAAKAAVMLRDHANEASHAQVA